MPVDSHLAWSEIRDFTPGLYTVGDQIMPASAAQTMIDCYALPGGGLRAWCKPSSFTTSGVTTPAQEVCAGLYSRGNIPNRAGGGLSSDYYMVTFNSSDNKFRLYRMDQTNVATTWSLIKTFAAGSNTPFRPTFTTVIQNGGAAHVYVSIFASCADDGVWAVNYSDGAMSKVVSTPWNGPLTTHQSRLIVCHNNFAELTFSDPGAETGLGTNTVVMEISRNLGMPRAISSFSPGDLLVQTLGGPIYLVEGDLSNYTLRAMSDFKSSGGWGTAVFGPNGVILVCSFDGVYETPDGSQLMPLSKQLAGGDIVVGGLVQEAFSNIGFLHHYVILGNAKVFNYDTQTWFTSSFMDSTLTTFFVDRWGGNILAASSGTNFTLSLFTPDDTTSHRCESYTWKSAPIRDPNGRQVEVRAVEVYARSRNGSTSTIAVTVNGNTQTLACDSSGRGSLTFYFVQRKEDIDIQVVSASNAAGVEAPLIEVVRVGSQAGHFLRQVADAG